MGRSKVLFDGEWVKTSMLSKRFDVAGAGPCEECRRLTAGALWYSIKRGVVRCLDCFTPEMLEGVKDAPSLPSETEEGADE